jgi:hypothetical protein
MTFHPQLKCSVCGPVLIEQIQGAELGDPCPLYTVGACQGELVSIDATDSREWTGDEIREKFLGHLSNMVDYWADLTSDGKAGSPKTIRDRLNGLAFSFLSMLDGCVMDMPAIELVPTPHSEDKHHHQDHGNNWWPEPPPEIEDATTIHGIYMLHELWHDFRREHGKKDQ